VIFSQSKATNQAAPSQFLHKHRDVTFPLMVAFNDYPKLYKIIT